MQKVRSSYGLFGIAYEVTYKVKPLTPMHVHHTTYSIADFIAALPDLKALGYSMMYYISPFDNKITVEFRKYNPGATGEPDHAAWALRNHIWGTSGPRFGHDTEQNVSIPSIRYGIIDAFNAAWRLQLETIVSSDCTIPPDQIIRYPPVSDDSRYTFSLFAFPEEEFPTALFQLLQILYRLLCAEGLPLQSALCRLSNRAGPKGAALLFLRRNGDDARSGFNSESWMG